MPWVKFMRDFRWDPPERKGRTTIAYAADSVHFVRKACADDARAAGAAVTIRKPKVQSDADSR